jgi:hypothetical protein
MTKILAGVAIAIAVAVFGWCQRREGQQLGAINQEIKASAVVVRAERADAGDRGQEVCREARGVSRSSREGRVEGRHGNRGWPERRHALRR